MVSNVSRISPVKWGYSWCAIFWGAQPPMREHFVIAACGIFRFLFWDKHALASKSGRVGPQRAPPAGGELLLEPIAWPDDLREGGWWSGDGCRHGWQREIGSMHPHLESCLDKPFISGEHWQWIGSKDSDLTFGVEHRPRHTITT